MCLLYGRDRHAEGVKCLRFVRFSSAYYMPNDLRCDDVKQVIMRLLVFSIQGATAQFLEI